LRPRELACDVLVVGGGLGGVAAAIAATRRGLRVILTEETGWLGGQLTAKAVPPDEHLTWRARITPSKAEARSAGE
jgi:NADPH-dependent 2,4-dienoyl-CoA reductase/sulfur reductase-like enzyme